MEKLKEELDKETLITYYLRSKTEPGEVEEAEKDFLDYISKESGVN